MADNVRVGLIQASNDVDGNEPVEFHKEKAIEKHLKLVREVIKKGCTNYLSSGNILRTLFLLGAKYKMV